MLGLLFAGHARGKGGARASKINPGRATGFLPDCGRNNGFVGSQDHVMFHGTGH